MSYLFRRVLRHAAISPDLRSWLLDSPVLRSVSSLALDAAACGLIDLEPSLTAAIALEVRLLTLGYPRAAVRLSGSRCAKRHQSPLRARIEGGVAVLAGSIGADGAYVSQTSDQATLHLTTELPATLVASLPGRPLASLVTSPILDARERVITSAANTRYGVEVSFDVDVVPIVRLRPSIAALSLGSSARSGRGRDRSR